MSEHVGLVRVALFGVSLVIGGHTMFWTQMLETGVSMTLLAFGAFTWTYLCITCALAEMTSVLPFSGGLYGFIRVSLGPYWGFVVGGCEMLQNGFNGAYFLYYAGELVSSLVGLPSSYSALFWVLMVGSIVATNLAGTRHFWHCNTALVVVALALALLYFAVTVPCLDCEKYGGGLARSDGRRASMDWFKNLSYVWWLFSGLEMMPMASSDVAEPKKTVPRALLLAVALCAANGLLLVVVTGCASPGALHQGGYDTPVTEHSFRTRLHLASRVARALAVPALYASVSSVLYVYAKQLRSMAESGLFPAYLKGGVGEGAGRVPSAALAHGAVLMLLGVFLTRWVGDGDLGFVVVVSTFATATIDISILVAFHQFRRKYAGLPKLFRSPFGVVGSMLASVVILTCFFSIPALFYSGYAILVVLAVYAALSTMYYAVRVRPHQGFSDEEQRVMFVAYVINANRAFKHNNRRRQSVAEKSVGGSISRALPSVGASIRSLVSQGSNRSNGSSSSTQIARTSGPSGGDCLGSGGALRLDTADAFEPAASPPAPLDKLLRTMSNAFAIVSQGDERSIHSAARPESSSGRRASTGAKERSLRSVRRSIRVAADSLTVPTVAEQGLEDVAEDPEMVAEERKPSAEGDHASAMASPERRRSGVASDIPLVACTDETAVADRADSVDCTASEEYSRHRHALCVQSVDTMEGLPLEDDGLLDQRVDRSSRAQARARRQSRLGSQLRSKVVPAQLDESRDADLHAALAAESLPVGGVSDKPSQPYPQPQHSPQKFMWRSRDSDASEMVPMIQLDSDSAGGDRPARRQLSMRFAVSESVTMFTRMVPEFLVQDSSFADMTEELVQSAMGNELQSEALVSTTAGPSGTRASRAAAHSSVRLSAVHRDQAARASPRSLRVRAMVDRIESQGRK